MKPDCCSKLGRGKKTADVNRELAERRGAARDHNSRGFSVVTRFAVTEEQTAAVTKGRQSNVGTEQGGHPPAH
jgi:hypothetical protein